MERIEQKKLNDIKIEPFINGAVNIEQHHTYSLSSDFVCIEKQSIPAIIEALKKYME